jgi:hypothetical protein
MVSLIGEVGYILVKLSKMGKKVLLALSGGSILLLQQAFFKKMV